MSDEQAAGAIRAVRASGRQVPSDVAISGWDNSPLAEEFGLITVAQSVREQGAACATAALDGDLTKQTATCSLARRTSTRG